MSLIVVAFIVMALVVTMMAIGVIFGRDPIKGSCGGLNKIGIDGKCEICGREPDSCETNIDAKEGFAKEESGALNSSQVATQQASAQLRKKASELGYDPFETKR